MKNITTAISLIYLAVLTLALGDPVPADGNGDWNPYVNEAIIAPAPLVAAEYGGVGTATFNVGNTGSTDLPLVANQEMEMVITLSRGVPSTTDPLDALTGTWADKFDWTYDPLIRTYLGIQNQDIPSVVGGVLGTIEIDYTVAENTRLASPSNGFNVNVQPPPYTNGSNTTEDDTASSYTFVRVYDYGDAPLLSYGIAEHEINLYETALGNGLYENYFYLGSSVDPETASQFSADAAGDDNNDSNNSDPTGENDESGVTFPPLVAGATANITVDVTFEGGAFAFVGGWIDWNGDGDFADTDEQITPLGAGVFVNPGLGTYTIPVTVPAGATTDPTYARFRISTTPPSSSGALPNGEVEDYLIQLEPPPGSITGTVFEDIDEKGNMGPEDSGLISGAQIILYDGTGTPIATNVTSATGTFLFSNLPPGDYTVRENDPTNYVSTVESDGGNDWEVSVTVPAGGIGQADFWDTLSTTYIMLANFSGGWQHGQALLRWETSAEVNTVGFFLSRSAKKGGAYQAVTEGLIPGLITSPQGGVYELVDKDVAEGSTWYYQLVEVDTRGKHTAYGPFEVNYAKGLQAALNGPVVAGLRSSAHQASEQVKIHRKAARSKRSASLRGKKKNGDSLRIVVDQAGIQKLDLITAGEALGLSSAKLAKKLELGRYELSHAGQSVSYQVVGSELRFYAVALDSPYTKEDVFWLSPSRDGQPMLIQDGGAPAAVAAGETFSQFSQVEEDRGSIINLFSDVNADYWYWDYILAGDPTHGSKSFPLPAPGAEAGPAHLVVNLHGYTDLAADPEHHALIELNGTLIGELIWDGSVPQQLSVDLPAGLLQDGANSVQITGLLDLGAPYGSFAVESFALTYTRRYEAAEGQLAFTATRNGAHTLRALVGPDVQLLDISNPAHPQQVDNLNVEADGSGWQLSFNAVAGARYYMAEGSALRLPQAEGGTQNHALRSSSNSADYLIIVAPGLEAGAAALADYRRAQGLLVMEVPLRDVYDSFNGGLASPHALQDFLAYAWQNWDQAPKYVLLAGSGTYDYKDHMGLGECLVPPMMVQTPYGIFASDSALADVDGNGTPEMALGRIPALSSDELLAQLSKIRTYEAATDPWKQRRVLAADNPDAGGNFHAGSDSLRSLVGTEYSSDQIRLGQITTSEARQQFQAAFSNGSGLINYIGHGGTDRIASEGLLLKSHVPGMSNVDRPAVLVALTCSLGRFELPGFNSLGEDLVRHENGGAVAVWAPSGLSINSRALAMGERFFQSVHQNSAGSIGDAIVQAASGNRGDELWSSYIYNLIGDPALRLNTGAYGWRPLRETQATAAVTDSSEGSAAPGAGADVDAGISAPGANGTTSETAETAESVLWASAGALETGVYFLASDTPEQVGIQADGHGLPVLIVDGGVVWYQTVGAAKVLAVATDIPKRMARIDATPNKHGQMEIKMAEASGMTRLTLEERKVRLLVMGAQAGSLALDISDPAEPVLLEGGQPLSGSSTRPAALYLSPVDVSELLITAPDAIREVE